MKEKILVINNDEDTMYLLTKWLSDDKYTAKYSSDYKNIKEVIKEFQPDILVVDMLQEEVAIKMKNDPIFSGLPVLYMTGYSGKPLSEFPFADDVIEKPFDLELFKYKVDKLLENSKRNHSDGLSKSI